MPLFNQRMADAIASREQQGLARKIAALDGGNSTSLRFENQHYVNFSSNDYLGLATDPDLALAWQQGIDIYGCGSGASPLVTGFSYAHQALEERLCDWLGYERAILFSSGFSANQAMLFSLLEKHDLVLQDRLNHASLMEAGQMCNATMKRFRHNDIAHLTQQIDGNTLVVTEGVFSMDGDQAPLREIAQVTQGKAWLAVDDAHGIGVLGQQGRGSCNHAGIKPQLLVVTFGKAFGLSGAAILCDELTGNYLTQYARHHVYSTAMPPAQAHALHRAVDMIASQQWRRDKLAELNDCFNQHLADSPGHIHTNTPIKPYLIGDASQAVILTHLLRERGLWLTAIRPPTVPQGKARLRITLTANHTTKQVKQLAESIYSLTQD
ncbi:8-amino-7-oxononanoate synthase [Vibrio taketomensis]|uniref:8-amino-7-oxononanoate synthase n=1 Tax=Vibrio taketomensis TaxID=2572923 RepID=UPI00138A108C|nr:8-amino-7-oxononanoate synthase [Vibrio taketomensis]